jgi:hypothetical protein
MKSIGTALPRFTMRLEWIGKPDASEQIKLVTLCALQAAGLYALLICWPTNCVYAILGCPSSTRVKLLITLATAIIETTWVKSALRRLHTT